MSDIKKYLRKGNSISETFLYNNRLVLNDYITKEQYESNRLFILRIRSLAMNINK